MRQIMAPGDRIFEAFLGDMRNFGDAKYLENISHIPRDSVRSMDYVTYHNLSPQFDFKTETITTRQGWIFIATNISVMYSRGQFRERNKSPLIKIRQLDKADGSFSGTALGTPKPNPETLGFLPAQGCYGPGETGIDALNNWPDYILTEPRSFLKVIGDGAICEITAHNNNTNATRQVNVILTGWEVRNG
jgi:hypothetical protein